MAHTRITIDDLLSQHTPAVAEVFRTLRRSILNVLPGLEERVYPGWHALGFRDSEAGYVCGLFPADDHVRLIFERGAHLRDPRGILEGRDRKQIRWITIHPDTAVPFETLSELLISALHHGRMRNI